MMIQEWASLHKDELLVNWELSKQNTPMNLIPPLA